ncbi:MAG: ribosome maturation factor RimP [Nitrospiria bacterium]
MTQDQLSRIKDAIISILNSLNLELVDLEYLGNARKGILRVTIDRPGGVTLEACEKASRNIGPALDVYHFIDHSYDLEVSSPGLDRPLKNQEDFKRAAGKKVRIKTIPRIKPPEVFVGRLISAPENGMIEILIDGKKETKITVLFQDIAEANLEVEW